MSPRQEIDSFLATLDVALPDDLDDDTPLISSGYLDSLALFKLVLWMEDKLGRPIDPESVDIGTTWDSIARIVAFIEGDGEVPATVSTRTSPRRQRDAIRVERYSPRMADAVAELQTGLWSVDADVNRRYLEWKYNENPYCEEPLIYLAYSGDQLIGMRGFSGSRWQIGSGSDFETVLVADDLIVHESHRNQGVVTTLMQSATNDLHRRGVEFLLNLSGGPLTVLGSLAMGWRSVMNLQPLGVSRPLHSVLDATRRSIAKLPLLWRLRSAPWIFSASERSPFAKLDNTPNLVSMKPDLTIETADQPRPAEMAALIGQLGHDGRIRHVRGEDYLEWRYRNPLNTYRFLYARSDRLRGFMVLKAARRTFGPNSRVSIVDWEADSESCLETLLEVCIATGAFPELAAWGLAQPPTGKDLLERHGLRPIDHERVAQGTPSILVYACDPNRSPQTWRLNGVHLLEPRQWDMRMVYSMAG